MRRPSWSREVWGRPPTIAPGRSARRPRGSPLEWREEWWERIEERLRSYSVTVAERNRRQAWFPAGSTAIENPFGSAPAFRLSIGSAEVWALPGVPDEFEGLIETELLPALLDAGAGPIEEGVWTFYGIPESVLDSWILETLSAQCSAVEPHICVRDGEIEVRIRGSFDLAPAARARFGSRFLGVGALTLPQRVVAEATAAGVRIAVAESCTGGRVAGRITDVPGSSAVLESGWVAYGNEAKERDLAVPGTLLIGDGAVSAPVAEALARGARERAGVAIAVSTTGIAGPGGGSPEKPIGTVWFGLSTAEETRSGVRHFRGGRDRVRTLSVAQALACLLAAIRGEDPFPWPTKRS